MKKLIYILLIAINISGCQSTTHNLGEQFLPKNPISVDEVSMQLKSTNTIKDVQIEGKVEKSCMSEGCWFTIKDASGNEILFDIKDKKFRVPINSPGKTVIVLADAQKVSESADSTSETQKTILSVKGLLFK